MKLRIRTSSKNDIAGAYLFIHNMLENKILGDSKLGTAILDLERIVRKSIDTDEWEEELERQIFRNGKEVGKLFCDIYVSWDAGR